jgi:hydroxypyruvate reductase
MAAGVEVAVGADALRGLVVTAPGCEVPLRRISIAIGSHPVPDRRSAAAARALLRTVAAAPAEASVLALISGGASSLLALPRPPLSLDDKIAVNRILLTSGADIWELNAVRKHLSAVKGGGLLRAAGDRPVTSLVLSDVVGDDVGVIGSAPTMPDPTTFADALAVLDRYGVRQQVPPRVRALLEAGVGGRGVETVKPSDPEARRATAVVVGSNAMARQAAAERAAALGYEPLVDDQPLTGDTTSAAQAWAARLQALPAHRRWCAIAGGETTVTVRGAGRGGRNQEFALVAALALAQAPVALLSAGTDGIDGPTDAAGAFADGSTVARAAQLGLDPQRTLAENDSYPFFERLGDLFRTGPTGTNVMDLKIAVGVGSAS